MKKLLFFLCLMFIVTSSFGQNLKALDDKYGFREAIFEMPKTSFKNLVEIELDAYKSTTENLTLGNYKLNEVAYMFYKGQLSGIIIIIKGYTNSTGVLKILQTAYGEGDQRNQYIETYYWFGTKVIMSYTQNSITDDAIIVIICKKLVDLQKANERASNAETAKKL